MIITAAFYLFVNVLSTLAWNCHVYSQNDRRYYSNLGCKVQCSFAKHFQQNCCVITKCPETCLDHDGLLRKRDEDWSEPVAEDARFKRLCSCLPFSSVVPFGPDQMTSDGTTPYTKNCLLAACEMRKSVDGEETRIFVKPGDVVADNNNKKCHCINGTDPFLMDAATLYHFSCSP